MTEKTAKNRHPGQFKPGQSGNPDGRPKGAGISITTLVKRELEKMPEGEDKKTYADLIVKRIFSKAIKDGDTRMIEKIWAYMDGLPQGSVDVTTQGDKITPIYNGKSIFGHNSNKEDISTEQED